MHSKLQETKLKIAVAKLFVSQLADFAALFPLYDNLRATEPYAQTSLLLIRHKLACKEHAQF